MDTLQYLLSLLSTNFPDYPVYRTGSMTEDEQWPKVFITFWQWTGNSIRHYDNRLYNYTMEFDINVYGSDTNAVYVAVENMVYLFKNNGFNIINYTRDRPSGRPDYIGQGITVQYINYQNINRPMPKL